MTYTEQEKKQRIALAERHKKTRYYAIGEVGVTVSEIEELHKSGDLNLIETLKQLEMLKKRIMNLR